MESKVVKFNLFYFSAIYLCEESVDEATLAICLKNRAAVHLKEEDYESVISDCTRYSKSVSISIGGSQHTIAKEDMLNISTLFYRSLQLCPNDPKALFRRCQAYVALDQADKAYVDGREVCIINGHILPIFHVKNSIRIYLLII